MRSNLGDAILFTGVWFALVMMAGLPLQWVGSLAGAGIGLLAVAYMFYDNARHRIDSFLGGGTAFDQVDLLAEHAAGCNHFVPRRQLRDQILVFLLALLLGTDEG